MKLSYFTGFTAIIEESGIEFAAKKSRELGFSGVEFFFMANAENSIPSRKNAIEYKKILDAEGLTVPCVSVGATIVSPDSPDVIDRAVIEKLKECVDFAAAIGSKYIHHTLVISINDAAARMDYASTLPLLLEGASEIADYAEKYGITVLYEPQGMLVNGLSGFSGFYEKMKELHSNVAVCGDVGNTYWVDEEPYAFFEKFASDIVHVHIKDYVKNFVADNEPDAPRTKGGVALSEVMVGKGEIDFSRIAKVLSTHGYSGYVSVEDGSRNDRYEKVRNFMSFSEKTFGN